MKSLQAKILNISAKYSHANHEINTMKCLFEHKIMKFSPAKLFRYTVCMSILYTYFTLCSAYTVYIHTYSIYYTMESMSYTLVPHTLHLFMHHVFIWCVSCLLRKAQSTEKVFPVELMVMDSLETIHMFLESSLLLSGLLGILPNLIR